MPRIEFSFINGGSSLPECSATGKKCNKPECLNDNGSYCRTSVGYLLSIANDRSVSIEQVESQTTEIASELKVDRRTLRDTVKEKTGR